MSYEIVCEESVKALREEVTARLARGWRVIGGVAVVAVGVERDGHEETRMYYYQAVCRGPNGKGRGGANKHAEP